MQRALQGQRGQTPETAVGEQNTIKEDGIGLGSLRDVAFVVRNPEVVMYLRS